MSEPTVFVVDDDPAVRAGLCRLLEAAGLNVEPYASAREFLDEYRPEQCGCLVLDIRMPGLNGLDLQEQLARDGVPLPIIILTGQADVPAAVRALKGGAVDFVEKPFNAQALLECVERALQRGIKAWSDAAKKSEIAGRCARLTAREREIMAMIVDGKASKVIAIDLDISERTVEFHRARVMKKMGAHTLAELIHMNHVADLGR